VEVSFSLENREVMSITESEPTGEIGKFVWTIFQCSRFSWLPRFRDENRPDSPVTCPVTMQE